LRTHKSLANPKFERSALHATTSKIKCYTSAQIPLGSPNRSFVRRSSLLHSPPIPLPSHFKATTWTLIQQPHQDFAPRTLLPKIPKQLFLRAPGPCLWLPPSLRTPPYSVEAGTLSPLHTRQKRGRAGRTLENPCAAPQKVETNPQSLCSQLMVPSCGKMAGIEEVLGCYLISRRTLVDMPPPIWDLQEPGVRDRRRLSWDPAASRCFHVLLTRNSFLPLSSKILFRFFYGIFSAMIQNGGRIW